MIILFLLACNKNIEDTAKNEPEPPPIVELSNNECPNMDTSGTSTFMSSDLERTVTVLIPDPLPESPKLLYFFHGLMDDNPGAYMANALNLQHVADQLGMIIFAPDSQLINMYGYEFYMWDVMEQGPEDLILFDDLRTCAYQNYNVDLKALSIMGFSGGALFSTVVMRERSELLASVIEMSGGSNVEMAGYDYDLAAYETPVKKIPVLLFSGGENDGWPEGGSLIKFEETTDYLQNKLVTDENYVVRCKHEEGHTITVSEFGFAQEWANAHYWGENSPYQEGDLEILSWCEVVE